MEPLSESLQTPQNKETPLLKSLQRSNRNLLRALSVLDAKVFGLIVLTLIAELLLFRMEILQKSGGGGIVILVLFGVIDIILIGKVFSPGIQLFRLQPDTFSSSLLGDNTSSLEEYMSQYQTATLEQVSELQAKQNWALSQTVKQKSKLLETAMFWFIPFLLMKVFYVFIDLLMLFRVSLDMKSAFPS